MKKKFINASIYKHNDAREILVEDGKFVAFGNNLGEADEVIDLGGKFVLPPYVDSHLHLDYYFTGKDDGSENDTGTLFEGIARWSKIKIGQTKEQAKERMYKGVQEVMSHGTQYIRAQTDCTAPELKNIKAMLEVRDELKDKVTIQVVALPQEGMYAYQSGGKTGLQLVEEALKLGADVVGGIPHFEHSAQEGKQSMQDVVDLALKYNKLIDVHCDETDDPNSRFVQDLNANAYRAGIGKQTTASHTCSFGSADDAYAFRMMQLFKQSGINFTSQPTENLYLQGRQDSYPKRRGITRVKEFFHDGINVSFGQDSICDPWYPAGNGNMMMILDHGIHAAQLMSDEDFEHVFDLVTYNGATTLHIEDEYGLDAGKDANFIVLDAPNAFEAIRNRADCLASIRKGEYLFKKAPQAYDVSLSL
ncbi:cytosine deaminase [Neisseria perflava]|uniref:amidohydrolase family protein n=1 Tax=Neisseria perflava TaxID=33053 RepID=UPI00209DA558|nr:amidohydrolase family protein [Neisseria perflava]MCP1772374.1 cytosine deaminase [Neisseria perflava]